MSHLERVKSLRLNGKDCPRSRLTNESDAGLNRKPLQTNSHLETSTALSLRPSTVYTVTKYEKERLEDEIRRIAEVCDFLRTENSDLKKEMKTTRDENQKLMHDNALLHKYYDLNLRDLKELTEVVTRKQSQWAEKERQLRREIELLHQRRNTYEDINAPLNRRTSQTSASDQSEKKLKERLQSQWASEKAHLIEQLLSEKKIREELLYQQSQWTKEKVQLKQEIEQLTGEVSKLKNQLLNQRKTLPLSSDQTEQRKEVDFRKLKNEYLFKGSVFNDHLQHQLDENELKDKKIEELNKKIALLESENKKLKQSKDLPDSEVKKKEVKSLQSLPQQTSNCPPEAPAQSKSDEEAIAAELLALRGQLSLDAGTIRNLENLLDSARKSPSASGSNQKELERERSNLVAKREEANRQEIDALRVRARQLEAELEQVRKAKANHNSDWGSNRFFEITEDTIDTEVRALREQIALNVNTIRNLEKLLQMALGSNTTSTSPKTKSLRTSSIAVQEEKNRKELDDLRKKVRELDVQIEQVNKGQLDNSADRSGSSSNPTGEFHEDTSTSRRGLSSDEPYSFDDGIFVPEVRYLSREYDDSASGPVSLPNFDYGKANYSESSTRERFHNE